MSSPEGVGEPTQSRVLPNDLESLPNKNLKVCHFCGINGSVKKIPFIIGNQLKVFCCLGCLKLIGSPRLVLQKLENEFCRKDENGRMILKQGNLNFFKKVEA